MDHIHTYKTNGLKLNTLFENFSVTYSCLSFSSHFCLH